MGVLLVTNNPLVYQRYAQRCTTHLHSVSLIEILQLVRDYIHKGHALLSHPLSGSVKPNETPYKSILISDTPGSLEMKGLLIIEESIAACRKFPQLNFEATPKLCSDFQKVDCDLIAGALHSHGIAL